MSDDLISRLEEGSKANALVSGLNRSIGYIKEYTEDIKAFSIALMQKNSCGNCKYGEYKKEYLYPGRCKKEKAVSYSEKKWMDRVQSGYVCEKWEPKKEVTK